MNRKHLTAAYYLNLLIPVLVAASYVWASLTPAEPGMLEGGWLGGLRFYTNLSNMFAGITALCYACGLRRILRGRAERVPAWLQTLALVGAAAISLTFLTVACYLAPFWLGLRLYTGASFLLHGLTPVLSILTYVLFDRYGKPKRLAWLLGAVPMLLYGIAYLLNCAINGTGVWPQTNDWYGFLNWGWPVGIGMFAVMAAVTAGCGALLQLSDRKPNKTR